MNINKNYILAVYVFWRKHAGGHRLHTRSRGRAKQKMNGHATGRDPRHGMRAAQGVNGYVEKFHIKIFSRRTAQETSSTDDAMAANSGVRWWRQVTERKHQTGQLIIGKAGTTSAMIVIRAVENWTPEQSARPRRTITSWLSPSLNMNM